MSAPAPKTRPKQRQSERERAILKRIKEKHDSADQVRQPKLQDIKKWRKQYNGEFTELDKDTGKYWFYVRKTYQHIQRMLSQLLVAFFQRDKFCEVEPEIPSQRATVASDVMSDLLNYYWRRLRPWSFLRHACEGCLRDAQIIGKLSWDKVLGGDGNLVRNMPRRDYLTTFDCLWDQSANDDDQITWFIHERKMTKGELWQRQAEGIYENVDEIGSKTKVEEPQYPTRRYEQQHTKPEEYEEVEVWEYWGILQLASDKELKEARRQGKNIPPKNVVVTVHEDNVILRGPTENPYRNLREDMTTYETLPFFIGRAKPKDGSTWGRSLPEEMRGAQREINKLRNQRRQYVDLAMGLKVLINSNKDIDKKKLRSPTFAGCVPVNGKPSEHVEFFKPPSTNPATEREENIVNRDIQALSGVTQTMQGQSSKGRQTATEVSTLMRQSNLRVGTVPEAISGTLVKPMLRMLSDMIVEYVTPQEAAQILGTNTVPPIPLKQFLRRPWNYNVQAGQDVTSDVTKVREMNQAISTIQPLMQIAPNLYVQLFTSIVKKILPLLSVEEGKHYIEQWRRMQRARARQGQRTQVQRAQARQQQEQGGRRSQGGQRGRKRQGQPRERQRMAQTPEETAGVNA